MSTICNRRVIALKVERNMLMNEMLTNAINCMKSFKLSKQYDNQMTISCGKCEEQPLTIATKGNFSLNALEILAAATVISTVWIGMEVIKKLKK